jgi:prepilin-type N-terminal cleavage/methylation domain-containing protein
MSPPVIWRKRRGVTLVEMLVVLSLLAVLAGVVAMGTSGWHESPPNRWDHFRDSALRTGVPVATQATDSSGATMLVQFLPDGSIVHEQGVSLDGSPLPSEESGEAR